MDYTLFGDQLEILVTGEDIPDISDFYYIQKEKYIRKNFLFPKSYSLKDKNQRDEIIKDHLGIDAKIKKNKIRTIFLLDFLSLIPYAVGVYTSFVIKKLKEFFFVIIKNLFSNYLVNFVDYQRILKLKKDKSS